jgi:hypothetical protein
MLDQPEVKDRFQNPPFEYLPQLIQRWLKTSWVLNKRHQNVLFALDGTNDTFNATEHTVNMNTVFWNVKKSYDTIIEQRMAFLSWVIALVILFAYLQDFGRRKTSENVLDVGRIYSKHKY